MATAIAGKLNAFFRLMFPVNVIKMANSDHAHIHR